MPRLKESDLNDLLALSSEQIDRLDYETSMQKLEIVVDALEQEGTPLELGLKLYELGTVLSRKCGAVLDATEEKMVQLLGDAEKASEEDFDPEKDGR